MGFQLTGISRSPIHVQYIRASHFDAHVNSTPKCLYKSFNASPYLPEAYPEIDETLWPFWAKHCVRKHTAPSRRKQSESTAHRLNQLLKDSPLASRLSLSPLPFSLLMTIAWHQYSPPTKYSTVLSHHGMAIMTPFLLAIQLDINSTGTRRRTSCQVDPEPKPSFGPWEKRDRSLPSGQVVPSGPIEFLLLAAIQPSAMRVWPTSLSIRTPLVGISGTIANPSVWRTA